MESVPDYEEEEVTVNISRQPGQRLNITIAGGRGSTPFKENDERMATDSIIPMASGQDLGDRSRFAKLRMATNDVLNQAYRDILEMEVPPSLVYYKVLASPNSYRFLPKQEQLLINAKHSGYENFDISLTYQLIRNICKNIPKPTKGKWGGEPAAGEVTVGDDIERIRSIRNSLTSQVFSASISQSEFDDTWSTMSNICKRLETLTGKNYLEQLNVIRDQTFREETEDDIMKKTEVLTTTDDIDWISKLSSWKNRRRRVRRRAVVLPCVVETDKLTQEEEEKRKPKTYSEMLSDIKKSMVTRTLKFYPLDDDDNYFLSKKLDPVEEVIDRRELVRQAFTEKTVKINLQKPQNTSKEFGLSISGGLEKKKPVTVYKVTIGSAADAYDLQMKDIILSVNRRDVSSMTLPQVEHIIDNAVRTGHIELKIKREIGDDLDNPKEDLLHHMRSEVTTVRHARGIVVGCAGAGKTTLLYSLMGKCLDDIKEIKSTRGLQVYEHIFTVTNGSLLATENLERKFLVRVPRSLLTKKPDKREDADQKEKVNTGDFSKLDYTDENTKPMENSTDLTSDIKGNDQITTASDTIAKDAIAETLSQEVITNILDAQENEISVSMIDFAGQFAYYACHQIYMRSSAFYILVMDMTKSFEEDVIDEEEEQKGSVFTTWKYKDYVQFWLNSIKSFGGPEAPVLIAATHTEDRTEDDIDEYFTCLWRSLPEVDKRWLSKHHSEENEFACELINIDGDKRTQKLQSLKKSLVEVVSNKLNTKISVRSSWALLEHLLQDSGKPIMSYVEIQKMNRKVPEQYRLQSEEEIMKFLTFFHDHGILLYFNGEATRTHAILSLQWFSNAFSRLIADKEHVNKDCRRRHVKEWELFNQTGELNSTLVDALWKDEKGDGEVKQSYKEYKKELMSYMERLRMLVSIGDTDETQSWYIPCMNKKPFTKDIIKAKACSSILCFRFTSFAIFVFYRLVAYCMSSLNWKVVPDKRDICLFQTAAVFEFKNQTVLLGIIDKDIQLQVVTHSFDIKTDVSCEVGNLIHKALDELTETFENTYLSFQRGYKCQMIFCDQTDTSFTPEEELCQLKIEEIQCPCCPMGEKHLIKVNQTRRFWEQQTMGEDRERNLYCLDDPLNRPPTDKELKIVSRYIGADFLLLGIELGLEDTKIQQIRMDYQNYGVITQIFYMLCAWKEKEGKQATVNKFLEAIEAHKGEIDIEKIKSAFNL